MSNRKPPPPPQKRGRPAREFHTPATRESHPEPPSPTHALAVTMQCGREERGLQAAEACDLFSASEFPNRFIELTKR